MRSLKIVTLAVCCAVLLSGYIEKGATVTDARYVCLFYSAATATRGEDSETGVPVSDSYFLSHGVDVEPQNAAGSTTQEESNIAVKGVPVSVEYLKSRGFDHVDRSVLKSAYVWTVCTIWYQNEKMQHHTVFAKQDSVQDGKFSFKDLVAAFEKCQIEDGIAVASGVGGGEDNITIHDLDCVHSPMKNTDTRYTDPSRNNESESRNGASDEGQDSTIESLDSVESQVEDA